MERDQETPSGDLLDLRTRGSYYWQFAVVVGLFTLLGALTVRWHGGDWVDMAAGAMMALLVSTGIFVAVAAVVILWQSRTRFDVRRLPLVLSGAALLVGVFLYMDSDYKPVLLAALSVWQVIELGRLIYVNTRRQDERD